MKIQQNKRSTEKDQAKQNIKGICDDREGSGSDDNEKPLPSSIAEDFRPANSSKEGLEAGEDNVTSCETTKEGIISSTSPKDLVKVSEDIQHSTLESPQSPIIVKKCYERVKVESDLSSDEEFKDSITSTKEEIVLSNEPVRVEKHVASGPRTPEAEQGNLCTPTSRHSMSGDESDSKPSRQELSRKPRLLPRRYQIEEEVGIDKRELSRLREYREPSRVEKRQYTAPRSPSPHTHHRRHHHSPPPEYVEKRWYHRGRPPSPGVYPPRRFSRSPPGYSGSPPQGHYSTSPPPPRCKVYLY